MKKCSDCKTLKEEREFFKNASRPDGLTTRCKDCDLTRVKIRYRANVEKYRRLGIINARRSYRRNREKLNLRRKILRKEDSPEGEKHRARQKVQYQVSRGNMKKGRCIRCGDALTEGHHDDYSKPLEVRWLCRLHHKQLHNEQRPA